MKEAEAEKKKAVVQVREEMETQVALMKGERDQFKELYVKESGERKKLHNTVIDLRGNIRVNCRVRPVVPAEVKSGLDSVVVSYPFATDDEIVVHKVNTGFITLLLRETWF